MAKDAEHWKRGPDAYDYPAATSYLSLLFPAATVADVIGSLRAAGDGKYAAKHLLRAAQLPLLPADDVEVKAALKRIKAGRKLAPVLLVRGDATAGVPLIVADGYQRICACYHLGEDTLVLARIANRARAAEAAASPDAATSRSRPPRRTAGRVAGTLVAGLLLLCLLALTHVVRHRRPVRGRLRWTIKKD